jgi:hypothetical protein
VPKKVLDPQQAVDQGLRVAVDDHICLGRQVPLALGLGALAWRVRHAYPGVLVSAIRVSASAGEQEFEANALKADSAAIH